MNEIERLNKILEKVDLEEKNQLQRENSQLKAGLQDSKKELDGLYVQLDSTTNEFERFQMVAQGKILELEAKIREFTQQNSESDLKLQIFRSESEKQIAKIIAEHDIFAKNLVEEINSLKLAASENSKNKSLVDELEKRLHVLLEENKKLNQLLNQSLQELKSRTQLQEKLEVLILENERLNQLLLADDSRHKVLRENMMPVQLNPQAFWELENKLNILLKENEDLRKRDNNFIKLQDVDRKLNLLAQENEKLNKLVLEKGVESQYWQERYITVTSSSV